MKVAVIGRGKTGAEVISLVGEGNLVGPFGKTDPPTIETLREADVAIIFVPGQTLGTLIETLKEAKIHCVWGTTGYDWPEDLDQFCRENNLSWVQGNNFALGMNLVRHAIKLLSKTSSLLNQPEFSIHEVHHTKKLDRPSGTALLWKRWLGKDCQVTDEREGDIKGIHELKIETENEIIELRHEAKNRRIFAEGAYWAAKEICQGNVPAGFHLFENVADSKFKEIIL